MKNARVFLESSVSGAVIGTALGAGLDGRFPTVIRDPEIFHDDVAVRAGKLEGKFRVREVSVDKFDPGINATENVVGATGRINLSLDTNETRGGVAKGVQIGTGTECNREIGLGVAIW